MRQAWVIVVGVALSLAAQDSSVKPKISDVLLTPEQIAVYRAVLKDYLKGSEGALNVANRTELFDQTGPMSDKACISGIRLETTNAHSLTVHRLDPSVALDSGIVLVDPDKQQEAIKGNDPQELVKKVVDDQEAVTDKQIDESVKHAFQTGLFTLSEIVFDKEHRRAIVTYSFVCGSLCGNGNTLVLNRTGRAWRVTKTCGGWVS
jgi:hypothetical protein